MNAIKGGGACHLREKVLAEAAKTFILIADARKNSKVLGTKWKQGVPIEVAPFAWASVLQKLQRMGCLQPKLRMGKIVGTKSYEQLDNVDSLHSSNRR